MDEQIKKFFDLAKSSKSIALISHVNPDRDAVSSLLSVYEILKQNGCEDVEMYLETMHGVQKGFLENLDKIKVGPLDQKFKTSDLVIIVDTGVWRRVSEQTDESIIQDKKVVVIDHHKSGTNLNPEIYFYKEISSNAQLIYETFEGRFKLTDDLAKVFLMGMFDDSGGFRFPLVDSATLQVASKLLETGIDISVIAEESRRLNEAVFEAGKEALNNLKVYADGHFSTFISREIVEKFSIKPADLEVVVSSFVSVILAYEKVKWGYIVKTADEGICRISFRSNRETVDVGSIAEKFGGGGHLNAAGAKVKMADPLAAIEYIENNLNA